MKNRIHARLVAAVALAAVCISPVQAVTYSIATIDTTAGTYDDFPFTGAAINNSGAVTYIGENSALSQQDIVVSTSGTPLIAGGAYDSHPVINDSGTVAVGYFDGVTTTGVYNATLGSFIYDSTSGLLEVFSNVAINSSGVVSFVADYQSGAGSAVSTANPQNTIDDTVGTLNAISATDVNDSGEAAYIAALDAGGVSVFRSSSSTAIDTRTDIFSAAINNNGIVLYSDTSGVYKDGSTVLDTTGTFSSISKIALNNNNMYAVQGTVAGNSAIYVRSGSHEEKVIATGDLLGGNQVFAIDFFAPQAINDSGQVVFWATTFVPPSTLLEGIYVATPSILLGDINLDGNINIQDNLLLSQYIIGTKTPTAGQIASGDMDQDSVLTLGDLTILSQLVLGKL